MKKYVSIILSICILLLTVYTIYAKNASSTSADRVPGISLNVIETVSNETGTTIEEHGLTDENAEAEKSENSGISTFSLGSPTKDTWSIIGTLNNGRADCDTVVINGELYIIGGLSDNGYSDVIEKYNSNTNIWEEVTTIPNITKGYAVTSYDDNIYIIGGCKGNTYLKTVQVYNTSSDTWGSIPKMIMSRVESSAVVADDKIYVFGGRDAFSFATSYEYYDLTEGKWTLVTTDYDPALNRINANTYYLNGYIFVCGGTNRYGDQMNPCYYSLSDLKKSKAILEDNYEIYSIVTGTDKAILMANDNNTGEQITKEIVVDNGDLTINNVSINSPNVNDKLASYVLYNGYIYRIGGYMSHEYSGNVYKYSLNYGDLSIGGGQAGSEHTEYGSDLTLNVETGHDYLVFLNVENMQNLNEYEFTIEYTDDSFTITDACAFTPYRETSSSINGTDLKVTENKTNGLTFVTSELVPNGKTVTKTINAVILRAKSSGQRTIKYSMTKK